MCFPNRLTSFLCCSKQKTWGRWDARGSQSVLVKGFPCTFLVAGRWVLADSLTLFLGLRFATWKFSLQCEVLRVLIFFFFFECYLICNSLSPGCAVISIFFCLWALSLRVWWHSEITKALHFTSSELVNTRIPCTYQLGLQMFHLPGSLSCSFFFIFRKYFHSILW